MLLVLSSIEDAFALSHNLDKSYFDKAKDFSENRAKTYLAGRALLQSVLQHFYSIDSLPNIKKTEKGKPFFEDVAPNSCRHLPFFNISHSRKTIGVAVSSYDLGIDLEFVKKRVRFEELKEKVLSSGEIDLLKALDEESQLKEFTAFWTIRESLLKLSGFGLAHLEKVKVDVANAKISYEALLSEGINNRVLNTVNLSQYAGVVDENAYLSYSLYQGEESSIYKLDKDQFIKLSSPKINYIYSVN